MTEHQERVHLHVNTVSTIQVKLNERVRKGTVLVYDILGRQSPVRLENPTWAELIDAFETQQTIMGDFHHIFVEGVEWGVHEDTCTAVPVLGS